MSSRCLDSTMNPIGFHLSVREIEKGTTHSKPERITML
jgi:hypothetical protein